MSLWTSLRDSVIKPIAAAVLAPVTGGASLAVLAADRAAAPGSGFLGTGLGGASGTTVQNVVQAATTFSGSMPAVIPSISPTTGVQAMVSPGSVFSTALGAAASLGMGNLRKIGNTVYSATGKILHVLVGGMKVTPRKAKALAKQIGLDAAAAALGISAIELAQMVLSDTARTSRGNSRGISGADLRRTRRTMNKIKSINKYLHTSAPARRAPARCRT